MHPSPQEVEAKFLLTNVATVEDLATALAGDGEERARGALSQGFATAGLAVIKFDGGLKTAKPGTGYLEAFLVPTDH